MSGVQQHENLQPVVSPFRLDVQLHDLLVKNTPRANPPGLTAAAQPQILPEPVFPRHPELLSDEGFDYEAEIRQALTGRRRTTAPMVLRAMRGWLLPYFKSRVLPGEFHPLIAYLFTEWKCNLDCHYCWAFDNHVKGMTEDIAKRSIAVSYTHLRAHETRHDLVCRL